jgi:haloacetate dehalogenase
MSASIEGFEQRLFQGEGIEIDTLVGGSGPPLLLLQGCRQT